jgi:hypothetical protein
MSSATSIRFQTFRSTQPPPAYVYDIVKIFREAEGSSSRQATLRLSRPLHLRHGTPPYLEWRREAWGSSSCPSPGCCFMTGLIGYGGASRESPQHGTSSGGGGCLGTKGGER